MRGAASVVSGKRLFLGRYYNGRRIDFAHVVSSIASSTGRGITDCHEVLLKLRITGESADFDSHPAPDTVETNASSGSVNYR
jgi:hypothetical protein